MAFRFEVGDEDGLYCAGNISIEITVLLTLEMLVECVIYSFRVFIFIFVLVILNSADCISYFHGVAMPDLSIHISKFPC